MAFRARSVTFANIVIENCAFDFTASAPQSVIEVATCGAGRISGVVALHHVAFQKNRLLAAAGMRIAAPSCSELKMVAVEISDNVCSSDACGVRLAAKNRLVNCSVSGNKVVDIEDQHPSLLSAPPSSETVVDGLAAEDNSLTVFHVRGGALTLSHASFRRNSLGVDSARTANSSCLHLIESAADIDNCSFTGNGGNRGSTVYARNSTVAISRCLFAENGAGRAGGCIHAEESTVTVERTNATDNGADRGGFLSAVDATIQLTNVQAVNNSARSNGGCVWLRDSAARLTRINITDNGADLGGCLYLLNTTVTSRRMQATGNSAKSNGGCIGARGSTLTMRQTEGKNNSADFGGFLFVRETKVALERTTLSDNRADEQGGSICSKNSTIRMHRTYVNDNSAISGGSIHAEDSTLKLNQTDAKRNSATIAGGFIMALHSHLELTVTNATGNSVGRKGGFINAEFTTVKMEWTNAYENTGFWGGFIYSQDAKVDMVRTNAVGNSASFDGGLVRAWGSEIHMKWTNVTGNWAERGGIVYAWFSTKIEIEHMNATGNWADRGGLVFARNSTVKIEKTYAVDNRADWGGCIYAVEAAVELIATNTVGNVGERGGCVYAKDATVEIRQTNASGNSAEWGGYIYAQDSEVTLRKMRANGNSAAADGGFVYATNATVEVRNLTATRSDAERGGCIYGESSKVDIVQSHFSRGSAQGSGGFVAAREGSTVSIRHSTMVHGRSRNGGAVWLRHSHLEASHFSVAMCEAQDDGGAVAGNASSTILCVECDLRSNSAKRGNGGAVFFDAGPDQKLAAQFLRSRMVANSASLGGGVFFVCSQRHWECVSGSTECPFVAMTDTTLAGNEAKVAGGGVFVGYLKAIRFRCSAEPDNERATFYKKAEWEKLRVLERADDICRSWRSNEALVYGQAVGTYATVAQMTTVSDEGKESVTSSGEEYVVAQYRSGDELPAMDLRLVDGLGQKPARSYRTVEAVLSASDSFLQGSIVVPMQRGEGSLSNIRGFVPAGSYSLTFAFGEETAMESISITVVVIGCLIGEILSGGSICVNCSTTTYNFRPSSSFCQTCPEDGDCETHVIIPNEGYWHRTPCSEHLQRCLTSYACTFEDRSAKLREMTEDLKRCDFDQEWTDNYALAQCTKVRTVLCASPFSLFDFFLQGSLGATLWVLQRGLRIRPVIEMQEVFAALHGRRLHSDIRALSGRSDGHHHSRHHQRSGHGSQTAASRTGVRIQRSSEFGGSATRTRGNVRARPLAVALQRRAVGSDDRGRHRSRNRRGKMEDRRDV